MCACLCSAQYMSAPVTLCGIVKEWIILVVICIFCLTDIISKWHVCMIRWTLNLELYWRRRSTAGQYSMLYSGRSRVLLSVSSSVLDSVITVTVWLQLPVRRPPVMTWRAMLWQQGRYFTHKNVENIAVSAICGWCNRTCKHHPMRTRKHAKGYTE